MNIQNPTLSATADLAHFRHFSSLYTHLPSTTVEIALQIHSFLTNKPNVKYAKISLSSFTISNYVQVGHLVIQTNKAKQTQFKPIKANFNDKQSQSKPIKFLLDSC